MRKAPGELLSLIPEPAVPGVKGRRARMRLALLKDDPGVLSEHDILEVLLYLAVPRRDTKPIAAALLARFGSLAAVAGAPVPALQRVDGVGDAGAAVIRLLSAARGRL